jgi:hypothetical protein
MKHLVSAAVILFLCSFAVADLQRQGVPIDNSPQKGPKDAPVTIIEFLDFQ